MKKINYELKPEGKKILNIGISIEVGYQMMILEVLLDRFEFEYEKSIDICLDTCEYTVDYKVINCYVDERERFIILDEIESFAKNWNWTYTTQKRGFLINRTKENIKSLEYIKNELTEFASCLQDEEDRIRSYRNNIKGDLLEFKKSIQI